MTDHTRRIALITGGNKGLGFETARQIGQQGHMVLLGARDPSRGEAAAASLRAEGIDARYLALDLTERATIVAAAREIQATYGRLDVLVNNAGAASPADGPVSSVDVASVRSVFEVNFFGTLEVIQAMLPLLKESTAGRVVNVSSTLGSLALQSDPTWEFSPFKPTGYNTAKVALNMLTVHLAAELLDSGIKVNSVAPGYTATDLTGGSGQSVAQGAAASVRMALLPDDGPTGGFFSVNGTEPW
ncbi:short-chain dehydrogenase [Hydrogenophaga crassostreae]|uniref:Short-chain dehydrogenase n=1 Tax=Hydrogenophaga crassostreae TaxID=1763535 RepID=A0A167H9Z6_9BURK|nr:SDR family oxidoreductase [Hydrogenophaga crassostreae]AOW12696.1 short-chain dehydrogenase [Hydrogenophaga crassostreae]OAD40568.1 short-chain dehydrogenase [Hydrogenophaga crassostreae]